MYESYVKSRRFCSRACSWSWSARNKDKCKKDLNHDEIVTALKCAGLGVIETHTMGRGFPDLIVGNGRWIRLIEIKNPDTPHGRGGLTSRQAEFAEQFPVWVVRNVNEALKAMEVAQ